MARQQRTAMRAKPLLVTEWNITMYPFNPINDSSFAATSLIRSALLADAPDVTLIHWTLLDNMSEQPLPMHEFHGGFGLITVHGLYKPTFFAMYALSKLYAEILYQDSNLCVTREGAAYRILAYHHPKTKAAYSLAYAHDESFDSSAPVEKDLSIQLVLEGLNGHYKAARHSFKPSSSVRAAMKNAGIACPLYQEDIAYLHKVPGSDYSVTYHTISQEFSQIKFQFYLPPSSFELLDLKPLS